MPKSVNPLARRKSSSSSSPFSSAQRTKPSSRKSSVSKEEVELDDHGAIHRITLQDAPDDLISLIRHVIDRTFDEVPERGAGMSSTQVAECLQFRRKMPPVVSVAHLQALTASSTETDRELARLIAQGQVRRLTVPGRSKAGSTIGEVVALVEDWKTRLRREESLDEETKDKYIVLMNNHPAERTVDVASLSQPEIRSLVAAGFLTNPGTLASGHSHGFSRPTGSVAGSISNAGSSAATGTWLAVGGHAVIHESGGGGGMLATKERRQSASWREHMTLTLPAMGAYLKLMSESQMHLLSLLRQLSPRNKEATWDMVIEKWNGNIPNDSISAAKRMRGEWHGVLPGRTRKFKQYHGLRGEWVLAECVGSGAIDLFNTGSVGIGVRVV